LKTFFFYLAVLEAAFLAEATVRHLPLISIRVDLVWVVVLYLGFYLPLFPGGFWVLVIGLAQEALGAPLHGPISFSYLVIYFFLRLTHNQLFLEGRGAQISWVFLLTLAQKGIELGLLRWQGYTPDFLLPSLLASAFANGLASQLLFPFLKKEGKILRRE
jgi:cell shape-determining protein MreD